MDHAEGIIPKSQGYERLDEILNDAMAEKLSSMTKEEQRHRHHIERLEAATKKRGQWFAVLLTMLAIAAAVLMEILGHRTLAIVLTVAPFVTILASLILSRVID